jgi:ABC-2 type transport system permease protein
MAIFLFGVPLRGSFPLAILLSCIFLFGALGMGILISVMTKTQLLASQAALVTTFLPAFLLSGFMFSIGNMPTVLKVLTYIVPARYFVAILKGIFLKGSSLNLLMMEVLLLSAFGLIVFAMANRKFVKRIG